MNKFDTRPPADNLVSAFDPSVAQLGAASYNFVSLSDTRVLVSVTVETGVFPETLVLPAATEQEVRAVVDRASDDVELMMAVPVRSHEHSRSAQRDWLTALNVS